MSSFPVAIALGSNLGDRRGHLEWAASELRRFLNNVTVSSIIETAAFDVPDEQPPYLNAVVVGETALSAPEVLANLAASSASADERGRRFAHRERSTSISSCTATQSSRRTNSSCRTRASATASSCSLRSPRLRLR
jgi:2-amino-4-hydroxy-6-hydroxymethyldihydropteridine diphosphokinase